jgi:hypothetical protein
VTGVKWERWSFSRWGSTDSSDKVCLTGLSIYGHNFTNYRRGFGLMTGFIAHFVTSRDYTLHFTVTRTHTH